MSDSKQPTYSSIHFDQAMDGTMASLVKHRNPANISKWVHSLYHHHLVKAVRYCTIAGYPVWVNISANASSGQRQVALKQVQNIVSKGNLHITDISCTTDIYELEILSCIVHHWYTPPFPQTLACPQSQLVFWWLLCWWGHIHWEEVYCQQLQGTLWFQLCWRE